MVVLEKMVFVYELFELKLLDQIETCANPRGLIALNPETNNAVLAIPDKEVGHVKLMLYRHEKQHVLRAHENAIAAMSLNTDGRLLATASEKGEVIRLTNTESG